MDEVIFSEHSRPRLILVTGPSGIGKTTWCSSQLVQARQRRLSVGGLLSPGMYQQSTKVGILLVNLASGEERVMARLRETEDPQAPTRKWAMDEAVLQWGDRILERLGRCDLLFIDELGPLEFLHHQGLCQAFPLIQRRQFSTALVVVRPTLLEIARQTWSDFDLDVHVVGPPG